MNDKEKQQILSFKKLQPVNVCRFGSKHDSLIIQIAASSRCFSCLINLIIVC